MDRINPDIWHADALRLIVAMHKGTISEQWPTFDECIAAILWMRNIIDTEVEARRLDRILNQLDELQ